MTHAAKLLKLDKKVFKTDDLALIWEIENRNTLLTTIKRYLKNQTLFQIRKGLYSIIPPKKLDPYLLGTAYVKGFSYVSLQTVLSQAGVINQSPSAITVIGNRSMKFKAGSNRYICKKMKSEYLHNLEGIEISDDYAQASTPRAIADTQYFNSNFHFDKSLDQYQSKVDQIKKKVFG